MNPHTTSPSLLGAVSMSAPPFAVAQPLPRVGTGADRHAGSSIGRVALEGLALTLVVGAHVLRLPFLALAVGADSLSRRRR